MQQPESAEWAGPEVRGCGVVEAFNLPLFEMYLVVDARGDDAVEEEGGKRLPGVHAVPPPCASVSGKARFNQLLYELDEEGMWPVMWKYMMVYGGGQPTEWVHTVATSLKQAIAAYAQDANNDRRNLFRTVEAVLVLQGGYPAFHKAYPMLCGEEVEDMRPSPAQVAPGLFLSSRAMDITEETVKYWGYTHVIVDSEQEVPTIPGLVTLPVHLPDDNTTDFTTSFAPVYTFIAETLSNPTNRLLVLFWGRSRSAILVLAYLVKRHAYTVPQAFTHLQACVFKKLDQRYLALDQVQEWADGSSYTAITQ